MELVGGPPGVAAIAGVALLLVVLGVLHFRYRLFRRRKGRGRAKARAANASRIEILETRIIDANRKLVLMRCDDIEHLVMVGGPADVVVENDVRKVRGPGAPPTKIPGFETERRTPSLTPPAPARTFDTPVAAAPKTPEPRRPAADVRPAATTTRAPVVQPPLARAGARSADPHPVMPPEATQNRASTQRPSDSLASRRDPTPPRRVPAGQNPPPPNRSIQPATQSARPTRTNGRGEPGAALPAAQIPWSDPDSIENEIVRALRFDPQTRGGAPASGRREPMPKPAMDSSATLGDLADRLEEALAREMQSAAPVRKADPILEDFSFDAGSDARPSEPPPPAPKERERSERRDRSERSESRPTMAAAPEPEARREPAPKPEHREETPVISLSSRRREAADPLEDEMARLLGELTSDTKGR
jgi:hypothetical protein